jgi:hypothetical protein
MSSDPPPPLLQIVGWDSVFEKTKSRYVEKCSYVCVPAKQDSVGLLNVLGEENGAAIYGIWMLLVQRCAKQPTPRAGWLTENGKPDGRRFTIELLSHMFRRPRDEIMSMFYVVTSPAVGWIAVVEGSRSSLLAFGIPDDRTQALATVAESLPPRGQREVSADGENGVVSSVPQQGQQEVNNANGETKGNRTVSELPPRGQSGASIQEGKGKERKEREKEAALSEANEETDPRPVPDDPDLIQHSEAKRLIGQLVERVFERKVREADWRNPEKDHWLDRALPMTRNDWSAVEWLYLLPLEHRALKMTARVQSFEAFLEYLRREIDKSRSVRRQLGLNGQYGHAGSEKPRVKISPEQAAAARRIFDPNVPLPVYWDQLSPSVRGEIEEAMRASA